MRRVRGVAGAGVLVPGMQPLEYHEDAQGERWSMPMPLSRTEKSHSPFPRSALTWICGGFRCGP